jgi:Domain of unknown function (DUF4167)
MLYDSNRSKPPNRRPGAGSFSHNPRSNPVRRQSENPIDVRRNYERYLTLARAAAQAGDTIEAENYYQHAEHFFRVMNDRNSSQD